MRKSWIGLILFSVVFISCSSDENEWKFKVERAEFLHRSVKQVTDVIVHDIFSPPVAARIYTYMSVAGYEAAIHQDKKYVTLAGQLAGLEPVLDLERAEGESPAEHTAADDAVVQQGVRAQQRVARDAAVGPWPDGRWSRPGDNAVAGIAAPDGTR